MIRFASEKPVKIRLQLDELALELDADAALAQAHKFLVRVAKEWHSGEQKGNVPVDKDTNFIAFYLKNLYGRGKESSAFVHSLQASVRQGVLGVLSRTSPSSCSCGGWMNGWPSSPGTLSGESRESAPLLLLLPPDSHGLPRPAPFSLRPCPFCVLRIACARVRSRRAQVDLRRFRDRFGHARAEVVASMSPNQPATGLAQKVDFEGALDIKVPLGFTEFPGGPLMYDIRFPGAAKDTPLTRIMQSIPEIPEEMRRQARLIKIMIDRATFGFRLDLVGCMNPAVSPAHAVPLGSWGWTPKPRTQMLSGRRAWLAPFDLRLPS